MSYLVHHGIRGQKWGVKHGPPYPIDDSGATILKTKTKAGAELQLGQRPTPKFTAFISKFFPSLKEQIMNDKQFNITVDGKRIGDMEIYKDSKDSLNVVWVGIDESQRGHGYASAAMNAVISYAKSNGFKQVTLEVPGNSPDARHIYEKLGFKDTGKVSDDDDVWGGLTSMRLKL